MNEEKKLTMKGILNKVKIFFLMNECFLESKAANKYLSVYLEWGDSISATNGEYQPSGRVKSIARAGQVQRPFISECFARFANSSECDKLPDKPVKGPAKQIAANS